MLKYKMKRIVDLEEWDHLVETTYGRPYVFQQQDGCKDRGTENFTVPCQPIDYENDTVPEVVNGRKMGVNFKAWLARDPKQKIPSEHDYYDGTPLFWERNFYPSLDVVAQDLYKMGLIKAGTYTIDIDW
jgi:hypothetical protein